MNLTTITTWIKNNLLISILVGVAAIALLFPKVLKGIFGSSPRRHKRRTVRSVHAAHVHRAIHRHHAARRIVHSIKKRVTHRKGAKKPWQVKGSLAARRHMALIRKRK